MTMDEAREQAFAYMDKHATRASDEFTPEGDGVRLNADGAIQSAPCQACEVRVPAGEELGWCLAPQGEWFCSDCYTENTKEPKGGE